MHSTSQDLILPNIESKVITIDQSDLMINLSKRPMLNLSQTSKNTSQLLQAQTNQPVTFDSYVALLESAAQQFDRSNVSLSKSKSKPRSVLQHAFAMDFADDPEPDLSFDVDMDIGQYHFMFCNIAPLNFAIWNHMIAVENLQ